MKKLIVKGAVWVIVVAALVLLPGAITKSAADAAAAESGAAKVYRNSLAQAGSSERADFAAAAEQHPALMLSACAQKFEERHEVLWK